jgi:hypothetical protein
MWQIRSLWRTMITTEKHYKLQWFSVFPDVAYYEKRQLGVYISVTVPIVRLHTNSVTSQLESGYDGFYSPNLVSITSLVRPSGPSRISTTLLRSALSNDSRLQGSLYCGVNSLLTESLSVHLHAELRGQSRWMLVPSWSGPEGKTFYHQNGSARTRARRIGVNSLAILQSIF